MAYWQPALSSFNRTPHVISCWMGILQPPLPCLSLLTIPAMNKVLSWHRRTTVSLLLDRVSWKTPRWTVFPFQKKPKRSPPLSQRLGEKCCPKSTVSVPVFHFTSGSWPVFLFFLFFFFWQLLPEFTHIHWRFERKRVPLTSRFIVYHTYSQSKDATEPPISSRRMVRAFCPSSRSSHPPGISFWF